MIKNVIFAECIYALVPILAVLVYPLLIAFSIIRGIYKTWLNWSPQNSIRGEVALITGSGRGLGRRIAIELAQWGCHLAIVDIQGELAKETAKYIAETYKVKTKAYKIDVTSFDQLQTLKTQITKDLGDVTILINNAGILTLSSIDDAPAHEIQRMINVNFNATVYTTQIFLPRMKQLNRGHIVNISSMSAVLPTHFCNIYGATKAAVRHLTSSLRIQMMQQKLNIKATTVMPTFLNTNSLVENLLDNVDGYTMGPRLDGDIVVYHLVRGMINGVDEVTVPRALLYSHKLLEVFPTYIREKLTALITQRATNKALSNKVTQMFQNQL